MTVHVQQGMGSRSSGRYGNRGWCSPAWRVALAVTVAAGVASLVPAPAMAAAHPSKPQPGAFAYVTSDDGNVYVIDTRTNAVLANYGADVGGGPEQVVVTPNGTTLYVDNSFEYVSAINPATKFFANINYYQGFSSDHLEGEAITPDGRHVYVAVKNALNGDKVSVIDTTTNQISATIKISGPDWVAISPNGKRAYVACDSGVSVINTSTNTAIATIPLKEAPTGMAIAPNGKRLFVTGASGNLTVINIAKRAIVRTIPNAGTGGVVVSPNGKRAYVVGVSSKPVQGKVSVVNTATDTVTATIPIGSAVPGDHRGGQLLPSHPGGDHARRQGPVRHRQLRTVHQAGDCVRDRYRDQSGDRHHRRHRRHHRRGGRRPSVTVTPASISARVSTLK